MNNFFRIGVGLVLCAALACARAQPLETGAPRWQRIELGAADARYAFAIYSNRPWGSGTQAVKSAVLVIHGLGRNGDSYYSAAEKLLAASGANAHDVLLIAPNFFIPADTKKHALDGMPLWSSAANSPAAWMRGGDALN